MLNIKLLQTPVCRYRL